MNLAGSIECYQCCGKYDRIEPRLAHRDICTGCGVCAAVCPKDAVCMEEDKETGFFYPYVDMEKCISCQKCERICPMKEERGDASRYSEVYAANNRSKEVRLRSASGGAFSALAAGMLKYGGCVAGVAYAEHHTCRHVMIESKSELELLEGTKYFQSDMAGIYKTIRNQIRSRGRDVMFCGTPCQVGAVKKYAQENGIGEKLFLVDLLCRGVPSPYVYKKYVELLEKEYGKKVFNIHMKEKTRGWNQIGTMVTFEDGSQEYIAKKDSMFLKSFIESDLSIRESCFHCKYKNIYREGDITIADFWGLKNNHLIDNKGTSLMIVSSEKGKKLFEAAKPEIEYMPSTMWRVYIGNRAAFHGVYCEPRRRKCFYQLLHDGKDLREAVNEALKNEP